MAKLSNLIFIWTILFILAHTSFASKTFNVLTFGAKGNGVQDSTQAFLDAWNAACASTDSTIILVPKGKYMLRSITFNGVCKSPEISFKINGTLVAPADYRALGSYWLSFLEVSGVSIIGGAIDAKGPALWACKAAGKHCPVGATSLGFTHSNNIKIEGLMSLNSQFHHVVANNCHDVAIHDIKIIAAGNSPNTDGIHVQESKDVRITNCSIKTGDDCISIGPGTENLWIERVTCGPGHGISIGSLAKTLKENGVKNVTAKQTVFLGSTNGFRIKSWARPSNGFVQGIQFIGATMSNVKNPIIIDQNYCPHNINCPGQVSGIKISDVLYQGIRGTSATSVAVKFDCSKKNPCKEIRLRNVNLKHLDQTVNAESYCSNVIGKALGTVRPNSCL